MCDLLLYYTVIFVVTFLVMVAVLYIWRPKWVLINDGTSWDEEVHMWLAFIVGLLAGMLMIFFVSMFLCTRAQMGYPLKCESPKEF